MALARKLDRESIVLLENDGVLPLDKKKLKNIAVIGPMAHGFMNVSNFSLDLLGLLTDKCCSTVTTLCTDPNTVVLLP